MLLFPFYVLWDKNVFARNLWKWEKHASIPKENKQEIWDCLSVYLLSFIHKMNILD